MSQTQQPGSVPPRGPVRDLPVWQSVTAAYMRVHENFAYLPKVVFLPLVISFAIHAGLTLLSAPPELDAAAPGEGGGNLLYLLAELLNVAAYAIFGVAWHRVILLGGAAAAPLLVPRWTARQWRFLGYALLFAVAIYAVGILPRLVLGELLVTGQPDPAAAPSGLALLAILVLSIALLILFMRLSFVFPAVSVDESYGLADSWRHTQRQGLRLVAAMLLTIIPILLLYLVAISILQGVSPRASQGVVGYTIGTTIGLALGYVMTAYSLSLISVAFRTCAGWIPAAPGGLPDIVGRNGPDEDTLDNDN